MYSKSESAKINIICAVILILIFVGLYIVKPRYPFQPGGIVLPMTKQALVASDAPVQVFQFDPYGANKLAHINVEAHSTKPTRQQQQEVLQYAKKLTQQAGGNGLVITAFGYEGPGAGNPAPLAKFVLMGTAIKD